MIGNGGGELLVYTSFSWHTQRLCVSEMIVRVTKRKFRKLLQESECVFVESVWDFNTVHPALPVWCHAHTGPLEITTEAIVHFLNCFLGEVETIHENGEEVGHLEWCVLDVAVNNDWL